MWHSGSRLLAMPHAMATHFRGNMSTTTWSSDAIKMPCMAVFIVETHYDPAHSEERMAARPAHLENLDVMRERGQLANAGPLADGSGAVLIYTVPDRDVLNHLLEADPYPKTAVQVTSVREWKPNYHHHV